MPSNRKRKFSEAPEHSDKQPKTQVGQIHCHHQHPSGNTELLFASRTSSFPPPQSLARLPRCSMMRPETPLTAYETTTPAETLPTELFHQILKQLPISSVLAVKFTCRAFYAKTLYHDGSEVVDLKKAVLSNLPWRGFVISVPQAKQAWREIREIAALLIDFEVRDVRALDKLTCSVCAGCKPHGSDGFGDKYFVQLNTSRYCNRCLWYAVSATYLPRPLMVHGKPMRHCAECRMVVPNLWKCSNCATDHGFHWFGTTQPLALPLWESDGEAEGARDGASVEDDSTSTWGHGWW